MSRTFSWGAAVIGLLALAMVLFGVAQSARAAGPWFVSTTGNDSDDCLTGPTACLTISAAIVKASSGDTINVAAGTYNEQVQINKTLTLQGAKVGVDARTRSTSGESIINNTCGPVQIMADNVTIDGFTIQGSTQSDPCFLSGIWTNPGFSGTQGGHQILNNIVQNNISGIELDNTGTLPTKVQYNLIQNNNNSGPGSGWGIQTNFGLKNALIDSNKFQGHTSGSFAVFTAPAASDTITFSNNELAGGTERVFWFNVSNSSITGNTSTGSTAANGTYRMAGGDSGISIDGNTAANGVRGIRIDNLNGVGPNSNINANLNNLTGNSTAGMQVDAAAYTGAAGSLDGTCNWWNNASGPSGAGPGTGDALVDPDGKVDFMPWLTAAAPGGPCNGPLPAATHTVTIHKYIDGVHANNTNGEGLSFPMASCWSATNIGAGCGTYSLAPSTYDAQTAAMTEGASYSTNEDTTGNNVGANCAAGKPFALAGYSVGDTEAQAFANASSTQSPSLTSITADKHVIVWNKDCTPATLTIIKTAVGGNGTFSFTVTGGPSTPTVPNITTVGGSGTSSPINLDPGTYNVNELAQNGWNLTDVDCTYNNQSVGNSIAGGEQITVDAGDAVTCMFTNTNNTPVNVTIIKYVDEVHATPANAATSTFPMQATYTFTNPQFPNGISGSDPYDIGPTGNNTPNPYEAQTLQFNQGASYSTFERTNTAVVGASCADGKPFALNGYSQGDSLAAAQGAATTTQAPAYTNMTSNKYVIVHNRKCVAPPAADVKVTIVKFINGLHATAGNANSASFPMASSWVATNLGGAGSGTYPLSTAGYNTPNAYEAVTSNMTNGSSYSTNENTSTPVVGANCANNQQFRLSGYSTGNSLAAAQAAATSTVSPAFTNITSDKFVIVWNVPCAPAGPPPPPANACATPNVAPQGYTLRTGTSKNDVVTLAPNTMFVGNGGNDSVTGVDGNYIICTGSGNDSIRVGNGQSVINAGDGNNSVTAGDGGQRVTTGSGNDSITTGNGADTISAGDGNNTVTSQGADDNISGGSGKDNVNAGAGTDTCNLGGGVNTKTSCELP